MTDRSRFIKIRVSDSEYQTLRKQADAQGVTMSEHIRATVTAVHKSLDVAEALATLRQQLRQALSTPAFDASTDQRETLLLVRELAAARDAQILTRVRAQLAMRADKPEQRGGAT